MTRYFSDKKRPVHLGSYPLELLERQDQLPDLAAVPAMQPTSFHRPDAPASIVNAMRDYQAMLDAIRNGFTNKATGEIPADPQQRANNLKGFAYFNDASMAGICQIPDQARLAQPILNPDIGPLAEELRTRQTKTLAAGIDIIMADLKDSMDAPQTSIDTHTHALVILVQHPRDPSSDEPGTEWLADAQQARGCLLAAENAIVLANYLRALGYDSRAHTGACSDVNLHALVVAAGLACLDNGDTVNPYIGNRFSLAAL